MDTYRYKIELEIEVDAFTSDDAEDSIKDVFGVGADCGLDVLSFKVLDSHRE